MKKGWTYKKLGEVCEVISGQSPESQYYNKEGKGLPFYQGKKEFTEKYIGSPTTWTTEITKIAEKGDLLMSVRAPVGDVNFATKQLCIGRGLAAIRIKSDVDKDYLFYYLLANKNKIKGKEGVGFSSINRSEINEINLQYPSEKSEQKRIVSRLDSAFAHIDALKANAEKQLSDAKALFQKALKKAMEPKEGWEEKTLGEVSISMADGPFGSNLKKEHYTDEREVRIIQLSNIGEEGWREENTKYTTFEHLENIKRSEVKPNDIVIAKMMPAGRAILCPNHEKKFVLSSDAVKVSLNDDVDNVFILYSINSPYFRKQVYANVSGSGRVRTSLTKLRDCILCLPSLSEQQKIVSRLDSLSENVKKLQEVLDKTIKECDALKQAMLRQVFE